MKEKEVIKRVLDLNYDENETISTLSVAIRGARELCERNIETGIKNPSINISALENQVINNTFISNKFLGLANYLIIIDLIGNIFKKKAGGESQDNFKHALNHFSKINDKEINSLKNLRNSLAHKFSLGNESEVFTLDYSKTSNNIILPATERYHSSIRNYSKNEKNMTVAFYENICDLVEEMYEQLKILNNNDELEILSKYKTGDDIKIFDFNSMYLIK